MTTTLACAATVGLSACSGTGASLPPDADAGSSTTIPAASCVAVPASQLPAGASAASGSFSGSAGGTVCPGGVTARVQPSTGSGATAPYAFTLGYTMANGGSSGDFAFASPAGATDGELTVTIGMTSAVAGQAASSASGACGTAAFTYALPVPEGLDCSKGTAPHCPDGCSAECNDYGCNPCTPQRKTASFTARAADDCLGDTQAPSGSWSLTLTSVTPAAGGGTVATPHGTLTATLDDASGGSGKLTLNLTF